jgi:DNA-binding MarR family transcriptional regulator
VTERPSQALRDGVSDQLRGYVGDYLDVAHQLARWMGLHSTDAAAFIHILYAEDNGSPLSPARLGELISLTSGATTTLINRLEERGCVARTREHSDRRVVTLRSVPAMHQQAAAFFDPLAERVTAVFDRYPEDMLAQFEGFLTDLRQAVREFALSDPANSARGH